MGHAEHAFRAPPPCGTCRPASRQRHGSSSHPGPAPGLPPRRSLRHGKGRISDRWASGTRLPRPRCGTRRPALRQRHGSSSHPRPATRPSPAPFPPAWTRKDFGQMGHAEHAFRAPPPCGIRRPTSRPAALAAAPSRKAARLFEPRDMRPCGLPAHSLGSGLVRPVRRILSLSGPAAVPSSAEKAEEQGMPPGKESPTRRFRAPPAGPGEERAAPSGGTAPRTCRSLRHGPPRRNGTSSLRSIGPASSRPRSGAAWRKRAVCPGLSGVRPIGRGPAQHRQTRRPAPAAWPSCGFRPRRSLRRKTEAARAPALFPPEPLARILRRTACLPREAQAPHAQFPELSFRP